MPVDFFLLGLAFILAHELDAMRCTEWRMFPGLALLPDKTGMLVFITAHVPLVYWIFTESMAGDQVFRYRFDIFLIIHLLLHIGFLWHKKNAFKDWLSWILITGASVCGMLDLLLYF